MSLRMFHMVFIGVTVVLAAFVAAWAGTQYQVAHAAGYAVTAALSLVAGGGLIAYGAAFQKKTRLL
jgi:FlaG/FlaF family flagellin (archaellin)